jgi:hypothetical protein
MSTTKAQPEPDKVEAGSSEREARAAAHASRPAPNQLWPMLALSEHLSGPTLQRQAAGAEPAVPAVPAIVSEVTRSSGEPLDAGARALFESRFHQDFSRVRVHTDSKASRSADAVGALAYTVGDHIAFAATRYSPGAGEGQRLLAHELTHVVQQAHGPPTLARQSVEQYETKGIALDRSVAEAWSQRSYWEQKIMGVYSLTEDPRLTGDPEERDAVLSTLWQMRPQGAISGETTNLVTIAKRAGAAGSKDVIYKLIFKPRATAKDKDSVEAIFVAEGAAAAPVSTPAAPAGFSPQQPGLTHFGFPGKDIDKYWAAHPEEQLRVFNWIENTAGQSFDQVITTSVTTTKGKTTVTRSASFDTKGTKDQSGNITSLSIAFLGSVLPSAQTPPTGYGDKDDADLHIEDAQSNSDPKKKDKLGTINGVSGAPADEQLSIKFAVWQYFKGGTRNAEVDAIVPIANTAKRVLYSLRFRPVTNNVDVERLGEEGKDVSLTPQMELARVNGFSSNSKDAATLTAWLGRRYPSVTPSGATVADIQKNANAQIQSGSGTPGWFKTNYGIEILDDAAGAARLPSAHKYDPLQAADMKTFSAPELQILELALEPMSDTILAALKGVQVARQKVSIELDDPKKKTLKQHAERTGITLSDGTNTTVIIFDAASMNDASLFLGGKGASGKPFVEPETTMTFAHEFGHVVSDRLGVKKAFDDFVIKKNIKPVTWYAASSPAKELFPEAFALFQTDPEWEKSNWPELYNWFDVLSTTGKPPPP